VSSATLDARPPTVSVLITARKERAKKHNRLARRGIV
jgi:hypothetical protein